MAGLSDFWDDRREKEAVRLWKEGKSATEIMKMLGAKTRSVIIGKLYRLGYTNADRPTWTPGANPNPVPPKRTASNPRPTTTGRPARRPTQAAVAPSRPTPIDLPGMELARPWETRLARGECAFPSFTIRGVVHSCCVPIDGDQNYCEAHRRLMFQADFTDADRRRSARQFLWLARKCG